jgi:hypothetical protein
VTFGFALGRFAVTLRAVTQAVKYVYLLTLVLWVGSIVFFSFVVAPTIFKVLSPEDAAKLQRAMFPKYYLWGIVCAGLGIACVATLLATHVFNLRAAILSLLLIAGCGAANLWMRQGVMPQMLKVRQQVAEARAAGRELGPELEAEWKAMHGLSVKVNGAVLLCGLVLLYLLVYSKAV